VIRSEEKTVIGGSTGRHVVAAATAHGLTPVALARDEASAHEAPPSVEIVVGDLEEADTLAQPVSDVDAVIFVPGSDANSRQDAAQRIDYGGDTGEGSITREVLGTVHIEALLSDSAIGKTFQVFSGPGETTSDWDSLFATTKPDAAGAARRHQGHPQHAAPNRTALSPGRPGSAASILTRRVSGAERTRGEGP
jgi:hypothetical protein